MDSFEYNSQEEEALINAATHADQAAFGELVCRYEKLVYNTVRLKIRSPEDALDIAQEIFIKIWKNIGKYRGECRFSTWVYKICNNAVLDFMRHAKTFATESMPTYTDSDGEEAEVELADESVLASPERSLEQRETVNTVRAAIAKLSPQAREVVQLRDIDGFSYEEISEMTGLEIGTVKSRLNRARSQLRQMLSELKH